MKIKRIPVWIGIVIILAASGGVWIFFGIKQAVIWGGFISILYFLPWDRGRKAGEDYAREVDVYRQQWLAKRAGKNLDVEHTGEE